MLKGIDHLVIVVRDLAQAVDDYKRLGFTVVAGGRHPVGSHNALISFADGSYIEIIAYYRPSPDHRWWQSLQRGEGLVDFCMQTDDLSGDTRKLRAAGVKINDPVPWSRTRPDGYQLQWLLSLARDEHRGVAPFLIEDITPRTERIPQRFDHDNGATGLASVTVAVENIDTVGNWYRSILGTAGVAMEREDLLGKGKRFQIGAHALDFVEPTDGTSPLASLMMLRGPAPYAATLRSGILANAAFDRALTHEARLSVQ